MGVVLAFCPWNIGSYLNKEEKCSKSITACIYVGEIPRISPSHTLDDYQNYECVLFATMNPFTS